MITWQLVWSKNLTVKIYFPCIQEIFPSLLRNISLTVEKYFCRLSREGGPMITHVGATKQMWRRRCDKSSHLHPHSHLFMYLSKLQMYLSKLQNPFVQITNVFIHIPKCICSNCKMYLSKLKNGFFQADEDIYLKLFHSSRYYHPVLKFYGVSTAFHSIVPVKSTVVKLTLQMGFYLYFLY